jgi:hypothetical protein
MTAYTGGELNKLNGDYGISAPNKSVPVMKLIKNHRPKSKDELYEQIKFHFENECSCGVKSKGTVEDFGRNLFNAQQAAWGKEKYTLQECVQWEYDLFVVQSLKGTLVEEKAIIVLIEKLNGYKISEADGFVDEELRIDLIVSKNELEICGIQVKPSTFKLMRAGVLIFNKQANSKWGKKVFYLYYDDKEEFSNLNKIVEEMKQL